MNKTLYLNLFILVSFLISACEPQTDESDATNNTESTPASLPQSNETSISQDSELAGAALETQPDTTLGPQQQAPDTTASNLTDDSQTSNSPNPSLPIDDDESTVDSTAIVEAIGFAEAQDAKANLTDETDTKPETPESEYRASCNVFSSTETEPQNTSEQQTIFCKKVSGRLASVTQKLCMAAKLQPSGCESIKGVPLMVREFPPVEGKEAQARVLVVGGIHGDELTSISLTFRWIETLNKYHSGLFHWHIIPSMNPDGLLKRAAERTNHNGVDLNRNLPSSDWAKNALNYWETKGDKNPRKYPGETANSEPETQWLVDEIELFKPDAIIAIHAPYGVVDFDAHKLNTAPQSLGKLRLNLLGTYPGSLGNYAGINLNVPVITLELPHAWEMPTQKESTLIWEDIVRWLKLNIHSSTQTASIDE